MDELSLQDSAFDPKAEQVIMGMWDRMKSLESKYIDLANYYKQELLQSKSGVLDTSNSSKSAVGSVVTPNLPGGQASEETFINELKSEKIRFEQNIKAYISNDYGGQQDAMITNDQLIRLNNEIQGAFEDIIEQVEQSQNNAIQGIGQRQTEMFQLTTKYRLPSGFKNDAVGVWYDAKSGVTQHLQKLRQFVEEKGIAVMAQTFQPKTTPSENVVQKREDYSALIRRFEQDMVILKQGTKDYNQSIQMIKQTLGDHENALERDRESMRIEYKGLMESLDDVLLGVGKEDILSQASRGQASRSGVSSPFDKKINTFGNRSGSRGPQKPPKLSYQQSALLPKASPLRSPYSKKNNFDINDVHPDLRQMRNRLVQYDASLNQFLTNQQHKENQVDEIIRKVEFQVQNNVMKFLQTHDVDLVRQYFTNTVLTPTETAQILARANLEAHSGQQKLQSSLSTSNMKRASVSPYRGSRPGVDAPGGYRKTTPTRSKSKLQSMRTPSKDFGSSGRFQATGESVSLQELQSNTDNLFNELRRANDKCISQQIEIRKLKDKNQVLSLNLEDMRMSNNRYQMQQATKTRKTKTTRSGVSPYRLADGPSAATSVASMNEPNEELELCKRIDLFFTAMKLLQRAVNKKEDISELKVEFEQKQRALQKMSKQIQSRPQNGSSQYVNSEPSESNLMIMKNRSASSRGNTGRPASSSFRGTTSPMRPGTSKAVSPKPSSRQDQDVINTQKMTIKALEEQLYKRQTESSQVVAQVKNFESFQTQKLQNLQNRLEQRETELDSLKQLFVERLRELESNFAEIGDHLINQPKAPEPTTQHQSSLQKFIIEDNSLAEQDEKVIEELTNTNSALHDQIEELKQKFKDYITPSDHQALKDELNSFDQQIRQLKGEKQHLVKMFDTLSKERDQANEDQAKLKQEKSDMKIELSKMQSQINDNKLEKEYQERSIEESIKKIQQQLKDEIEQKICFQKESKDNDNLAKLLEEENEGYQTQLAALEMERAQMKHELELAEEQLEKVQEQCKSLKEDYLTAKEEKDELLAENNARLDQLEETEEQLQALKDILKTKGEELEQSQELIAKLEEELRDGDLTKADEAEIQEIKKKLAEAQAESEKKQKIADEAEQKLQDLEDEAEARLQEAKIETEKKLEAQRQQLKEAEDLVQAAKLEAEYKISVTKEEAQKEAQQQLEAAQVETEQKIMAQKVEAMREAKEQLEAIQQESEQKLQDSQRELSSLHESSQQELSSLKQQTASRERYNWWMTALQLRVKRSLQQKLEKQEKELLLLKEQLQNKEMGDSEQVKQLTEKEQQLREKLQQEIDSSQQQIQMIQMESNQENSKKQREIEDLKKDQEEFQSFKQKEIEQLKKAQDEKDQQIEELKTAKEKEIEELRKAELAKAEELEKLKRAEEAKAKEIEDLKNSGQDKLSTLEQAKQTEITQKQEELKSLKQEKAQQEQEIISLKEQLSTVTQEKKLESEKLTNECESLNKNFEDVNKRLYEKIDEIEDLQRQLELNKQKIEELEYKVNSNSVDSSLDAKLDEKENEITKLTDLNDDLDLKISEQFQEIEELKQTNKDLQEKMNVDNDLVTMLLAEKKEAKETAVEMENIIDSLEKERDQLQLERPQHQKKLEEATVEAESQSKAIEELNSKIEQMVEVFEKDKKVKAEQVQSLQDELSLVKKERDDLQKNLEASTQLLEKTEVELKSYKEKLDETHQDLSSKVDSGHDNVKKIVDIHKTNEDLSGQLLNKSEQCKKLQQDLENQKIAYEVLLDQIANLEANESNLVEQVKNFEEQVNDLKNKRTSTAGISRASIGSDEEYSSVSEMKDHLKHARQILIQFIGKLPYSAPDNEATLPIIFSMFEFTKDEQEKVTEARKLFNQEKIAGEVKDKTKKMFGNFMKKKGNKTDGSFNSGGTNTNQSQGK